MILRLHLFSWRLPAILASGLFLVSGAPAQAQSVTDFFLLIPEASFARWNEVQTPLTPETRAKMVKTGEADREALLETLQMRDLQVDTKNGFLSFTSEGGGEGMNVYVTFWKTKKTGVCLVALTIDEWSAAKHVTGTVEFFEWSSASPESLVNVTGRHVPDLHPGNFHETSAETSAAAEKEGLRWAWVLPQNGTTIRIQAAEVGENPIAEKLGPPAHAYLMEWNGTNFKLRKVDAGAEQ